MIRKMKYIAIFSLSTLIFIIGIIIGQLIAETKIGEFSHFALNLRTSLLSIDTLEKIGEKYICDVNIFKLTEEKIKLGRTLTFLEEKLGRADKKVIEMKKEYSLLSIRQWLLAEKYKERCNKDLTIILFFYSNERNASESEKQGYVLDYIYAKHPEKVVIYAFDFDLESRAIDSLEEIFEIKQVPSLVINQRVYEGFVRKEEIEEILKTFS